MVIGIAIGVASIAVSSQSMAKNQQNAQPQQPQPSAGLPPGMGFANEGGGGDGGGGEGSSGGGGGGGGGGMASPKIGIGVWVINKETGEFILGRKRTSWGLGKLQVPSGPLQIAESFSDCATRLVKHELSMKVKNVEQVGVTNDVIRDTTLGLRHLITVWVKAELVRKPGETGEPQLPAPNEAGEGWVWMSWDELQAMSDKDQEKRNWFLPLINFLEEGYQVP